MQIAEFIPGRLYGGTQIDGEGWRRLAQLGVTAILNVREREEDVPGSYPYPLAVYQFPLENKSSPPLQELVQAVETVVSWLAEGRIVYVHDVAGKNRLGFLLTAILMRLYRLPWRTALEKAREQRPVLAPRSQFQLILERYERFLQIRGQY
ncbi:dual specificity protein phosphatase-like protein [Tumebacillus sp. BK434]|uniref:protein-tyrosine phosphatase family protein n=1 Tax=Tumebacillus sp. BK434 TaxID=2512169 RepID=UPI001047A8C9|nr:dual specificity protein phosphatase [Tumebacillus sp. BK434]TCP58178.1 dual specificity protein phosphatase-like protein [Tumebacillus sp. BK434]